MNTPEQYPLATPQQAEAIRQEVGAIVGRLAAENTGSYMRQVNTWPTFVKEHLDSPPRGVLERFNTEIGPVRIASFKQHTDVETGQPPHKDSPHRLCF